MTSWLRRLFERGRRDTSGQALVEFAIVTPLIILVFFFAVWFHELVHIKLKVQEAGRYAAWEATAYQLHDYEQGPNANSQLSSDAVDSIRQDTVERYADLDSSTTDSVMMTRLFAASYTQPLVVLTDRQEAAIPGGQLVNWIFSIAAGVFDLISALNYQNINPIAVEMIGTELFNSMGGARMDRMFGNSDWGFNRQGYFCSNVTVAVTNSWVRRGVGAFIMPDETGLLMISSARLMSGRLYGHCVLADSWRLNSGDSIGRQGQRPGVSSGTGYWEQVNRMYFSNSNARGVADRYTRLLRDFATILLAFAQVSATPPNLGDQDWVQATVVARTYSGQNAEQEGKIQIQQDRGNTRTYDTAPVGRTGNAGQGLEAYGETLEDRGPNYMGCPDMMQLGCPTATLQQDNPFGDYVYRGGGHGGGSGGGTP